MFSCLASSDGASPSQVFVCGAGKMAVGVKETIVEYIKENGLEDKVIFGGPCILVEGDGIISSL